MFDVFLFFLFSPPILPFFDPPPKNNEKNVESWGARYQTFGFISKQATSTRSHGRGSSGLAATSHLRSCGRSHLASRQTSGNVHCPVFQAASRPSSPPRSLAFFFFAVAMVVVGLDHIVRVVETEVRAQGMIVRRGVYRVGHPHEAGCNRGLSPEVAIPEMKDFTVTRHHPNAR